MKSCRGLKISSVNYFLVQSESRLTFTGDLSFLSLFDQTLAGSLLLASPVFTDLTRSCKRWASGKGALLLLDFKALCLSSSTETPRLWE